MHMSGLFLPFKEEPNTGISPKCLLNKWKLMENNGKYSVTFTKMFYTIPSECLLIQLTLSIFKHYILAMHIV
jgi:hypothetical protein